MFNLNDHIRAHRDCSPSKSMFDFREPMAKIVCKDGFSVSVQVGSMLYSSPRNDQGPWTEVEVGFPSSWDNPAIRKYREASWGEETEQYTENSGDVACYVPIELVEAWIDQHGGLA